MNWSLVWQAPLALLVFYLGLMFVTHILLVPIAIIDGIRTRRRIQKAIEDTLDETDIEAFDDEYFKFWNGEQR